MYNKQYTHAACFLSLAGTLAFSHYVTAAEFKYWPGMIFLPVAGLKRYLNPLSRLELR